MKKILSVLVILFVVISGSYAEAPKFSEYEKATFKLIEELRKYAPKIGFEEKDVYTEFGEVCKGYNTLYFQKNTDLVFSYFDPKMKNEDFEIEDLDEILKIMNERGYYAREYSFYLLKTIGSSGEHLITKRVLNSDRDYVIETFFHENFHKMFSSTEFVDEASADVVGMIAKGLFLGEGKIEIYAELKNYEVDSVIPSVNCFEKISKLHELYLAGKISKKSYVKNKLQIVKKYGYDGIAHFSFGYTYRRYFSLMMKLMIRLDYSVVDFIKFLRTMPFSGDKIPSITDDESFKIYLDKEAENVRYVENFIGKK